MRRILIDDIRVVVDVDVICRTSIEAFQVLDKDQNFDVYFFDHDMGEEKPGTTGYDILKWALENDKINEKASIFLITNNPVGRDNMAFLLKAHDWFNKGIEWVKQ